MTPLRCIAKLTLLVTLAGSSLAVLANTAWANTDYSGTWSKKSFSISGTCSITGNTLTTSDDFKTQSAPDLKIFLFTAPLAELSGNNAITNAVLISPLTSPSGG